MPNEMAAHFRHRVMVWEPAIVPGPRIFAHRDLDGKMNLLWHFAVVLMRNRLLLRKGRRNLRRSVGHGHIVRNVRGGRGYQAVMSSQRCAPQHVGLQMRRRRPRRVLDAGMRHRPRLRSCIGAVDDMRRGIPRHNKWCVSCQYARGTEWPDGHVRGDLVRRQALLDEECPQLLWGDNHIDDAIVVDIDTERTLHELVHAAIPADV
mmetsp:Transcript_78221/g.198804  ORF Transcript_78221/g.198804 Transcript_78221/m.198804 type:complete len:205 (-) Transcript_78221:171-785(-)